MNKIIPPLQSFLLFVILTFGASWTFWILAALTGQDVMNPPVLVLHTLGGLSPSIAGIFMVYRLRDKERWHGFWQRVFDFRRIGVQTILWTVLLFPSLVLASIWIGQAFGAEPHTFQTVKTLISQPGLLVFTLIMGMITGPLSEELGWRGFAVDVLQQRWGALSTSILLGLVWWAWHLPLFFIVGTTQYHLGIGTQQFWVFLLNILPLSAIITWFYNRTRSSIFSAILLHYSFNVSANLFFPLSPMSSWIYPFLLLLVAAGLYLLQPVRKTTPAFSIIGSND